MMALCAARRPTLGPVGAVAALLMVLLAVLHSADALDEGGDLLGARPTVQGGGGVRGIADTAQLGNELDGAVEAAVKAEGLLPPLGEDDKEMPGFGALLDQEGKAAAGPPRPQAAFVMLLLLSIFISSIMLMLRPTAT